MRLFSYRPQALAGAWGKPAVLVNRRTVLNLFNESAPEPAQRCPSFGVASKGGGSPGLTSKRHIGHREGLG